MAAIEPLVSTYLRQSRQIYQEGIYSLNHVTAIVCNVSVMQASLEGVRIGKRDLRGWEGWLACLVLLVGGGDSKVTLN